MATVESPFMTVKETAEYLKLSTTIVYILAKDKQFPAVRIKGTWRIFRSDLDKWIKKQYQDKPELWTIP
jgi:excisionase family DNA binding protein